MEEIELRDALRQHVQRDEPPMAFTGTDLVDQGRRQKWWRLSAATGSGSAVAAIAVLVAVTVSAPGGPPTLAGPDCSVPLAGIWSPMPSGTPDGPYPTEMPTAGPTEWPNPSDTPAPSDWPTPSDFPTADPTADPTPDPTGQPNTTAGPPSPGGGRNEPQTGDSGKVVPPPTSSDYPAAPGRLHPENEARMLEAQCYLARKLKELLPDSVYAQWGSDGPMVVNDYPDLRPAPWNRGYPCYGANAIIIDPRGEAQFAMSIETPHESHSVEGGGWVTKQFDSVTASYRDDGTNAGVRAVLITPDSMITFYMTGELLTMDQLFDLGDAIELDMFR